MKYLVFLILLLVTRPVAFSQAKEFIIKNNGDTVNGKVTFHNRLFSIEGAGGSQENYAAADVKQVSGYGAKAGFVYTGKLILYSSNLLDLQKMYFRDEVSDTVLFLTQIYETPRVRLYQGFDNFRTLYFFYSTAASVTPVQLVVKYSLSGGTYSLAERMPFKRTPGAEVIQQKGYANQLRAILGDCDRVPADMWESLEYTYPSLRALLKQARKCK